MSAGLGTPHFGGEQREEMLGEQADVLDAVAQRRHLDEIAREAEVQVLAEGAAAIRSSRSALVAATMRTSTRFAWLAPTGTISPSSSTRSSLAWSAGAISPISSRKSVPPSASSNHPLRSDVAPVNEPRTWPNSIDSASSPGMATQFTGMNGPADRGLRQ